MRGFPFYKCSWFGYVAGHAKKLPERSRPSVSSSGPDVGEQSISSHRMPGSFLAILTVSGYSNRLLISSLAGLAFEDRVSWPCMLYTAGCVYLLHVFEASICSPATDGVEHAFAMSSSTLIDAILSDILSNGDTLQLRQSFNYLPMICPSKPAQMGAFALDGLHPSTYEQRHNRRQALPKAEALCLR